MVEIGERIKRKREELGHKQQSFAEKIKIDKSSLNRYEKGVQTPSVETLVAIANGLEVSLDYLIYGTGDENTARKKDDAEDYIDKSLRAIVALVENGLMVVERLTLYSGISINFKKTPSVLNFFDEVANFCKCKGRIDDSSYEKGIDKIIKEYHTRILCDKCPPNAMEFPDYSLMQKNSERYVKIMETLAKKYGITKAQQ